MTAASPRAVRHPRASRRWMLAGLLICLPVLLAVMAAQAQTVEPARPFSHIVADWNQTLAQVERYLQGDLVTPQRTRANRDQLQELSRQAQDAKAAAAKRLAEIERLLAALGAAPTEGGTPETREIAEQRSRYREDLSFFRARVQQAELAAARAAQLDTALSDFATRRLLDRLLSTGPSPVDIFTVTEAAADALRMAGSIAASPREWWASVPESRRTFGVALRVSVLVLIAVAIGAGLRYVLLRRYGRDPSVTDATYARRLLCAVAEGVARGIVPALFFAGILLRTVSETILISGLFAEIVYAFCLGMILIVTAPALARAVLSPHLPAWQINPLEPESAVRISTTVTLLALVAGADIFARTLFDALVAGAAFRSVFSAAFNFAEAALLISLARASLWHFSATADAESTGTATADAPAEGDDHSHLWSGVRAVIALVAISSIAASWLGYTTLGDYLNRNLLGSLIVAVLLYLLRGLLREMVGALTRSTLLRDRLAVSHASRNVVKFWLRIAVDAVFVFTGLVLIAPFWGVPHEELQRFAISGLTGFSIGSISISFVDLLLGILVFVVLLAGTRVLQRVLADRILPQTHLEPGIQHSVTAGLGYVGVVVAATVGITTLGVDLSNLAIIAGALSVGIGFGLQNIVNNFVSGLILLVERPIKVGDWVVVGGNEGLVKRISVRATEIQTFQRASVIVPNAEFLSNALTNWTHKDRNGRVDIAVGVAYGCDIRKVEEILLRLAAAHEEVLAVPEPFVLFTNFGASSLDFELRCYTANVFRRIRIASALRFAIDDAFREAGIEIPFPQHVVHMARDGTGGEAGDKA